MELFKTGNPIRRFVESASYLDTYYSNDESHESYTYANLVEDAMMRIYPAQEEKLDDAAFKEMMDPLVYYILESEYNELLPEVRQTIQKLFGDYNKFNQFIDTHFEISNDIRKVYITDLGLNQKKK